ncbi:MAG TPA: hypothetical protein VIO35_09175 [Chloroflexota bacterium]
MDTPTADPQTRAELLPRIAAARARLDQVVGRLSDEHTGWIEQILANGTR